MALKKAVPARTPASGPLRDAWRLSGGPLTVTAQGALYRSDDRLIIAVRVVESDGTPVTGLNPQHFRLWQLGHFFDALTVDTVVEVTGIGGLEGMYQVVHHQWGLAGNGTIPFYVHVSHGPRAHGSALTFAVKVHQGLDG